MKLSAMKASVGEARNGVAQLSLQLETRATDEGLVGMGSDDALNLSSGSSSEGEDEVRRLKERIQQIEAALREKDEVLELAAQYGTTLLAENARLTQTISSLKRVLQEREHIWLSREPDQDQSTEDSTTRQRTRRRVWKDERQGDNENDSGSASAGEPDDIERVADSPDGLHPSSHRSSKYAAHLVIADRHIASLENELTRLEEELTKARKEAGNWRKMATQAMRTGEMEVKSSNPYDRSETESTGDRTTSRKCTRARDQTEEEYIDALPGALPQEEHWCSRPENQSSSVADSTKVYPDAGWSLHAVESPHGNLSNPHAQASAPICARPYGCSETNRHLDPGRTTRSDDDSSGSECLRDRHHSSASEVNSMAGKFQQSRCISALCLPSAQIPARVFAARLPGILTASFELLHTDSGGLRVTLEAETNTASSMHAHSWSNAGGGNSTSSGIQGSLVGLGVRMATGAARVAFWAVKSVVNVAVGVVGLAR
ncbi:hypothetical protein HDU93_006267 [Gonapodya sp. JEL0774]|nr:hypothetical protein HDU93_006267 [Gonapodya sp. JEL0774]